MRPEKPLSRKVLEIMCANGAIYTRSKRRMGWERPFLVAVGLATITFFTLGLIN